MTLERALEKLADANTRIAELEAALRLVDADVRHHLRGGHETAARAAILPRAEAVKLISRQLNVCIRTDAKSRKFGAAHYGVQELRELLDAIYQQEPQSDDEKITVDKPI